MRAEILCISLEGDCSGGVEGSGDGVCVYVGMCVREREIEYITDKQAKWKKSDVFEWNVVKDEMCTGRIE